MVAQPRNLAHGNFSRLRLARSRRRVEQNLIQETVLRFGKDGRTCGDGKDCVLTDQSHDCITWDEMP